MMQSYMMMEEGVMEIPQVKPLQYVPSEATPTNQAPQAISQATVPAPAKALPAPPTTKTKAAPPKAAPSKVSTKRPAPAREEADPAAKRQKVKKDLAAKASRFEQKKREEEEKLKKAQRKKAQIQARLERIREKTTWLLDENVLVQGSLMRSRYIPFTPDESEICYLETDIQACKKTLRAMERTEGYTKEEWHFIRKLINERAPLFNSKQSERFISLLKEMTERPFAEIEKRRAEHPDARFIEDFISEELKESWDVCREKFIKAYDFWKVVLGQDSSSKLDALNNFMVVVNDKLWRMILIETELADPKLIIRISERKLFPKPRVSDSRILDRGVIEDEIDEALHLARHNKASEETSKTMKSKVLSAYIMDES